MVRCCRLVGASLLLVFCTSANGSCDMDAARRNSTACHNVFADENSFVQSWKRADRVPADQHPWLPTSGLQLKTMWWAPIMWLVVLVPLAVMLCMATKPEKGATEALLHSQNQAAMRIDKKGGGGNRSNCCTICRCGTGIQRPRDGSGQLLQGEPSLIEEPFKTTGFCFDLRTGYSSRRRWSPGHLAL